MINDFIQMFVGHMSLQELAKNRILIKLIPLMVAVLVFAATVSMAYPVFEYSHKCIHESCDEDCPICQILKICEGTVKVIGAGSVSVILVGITVYSRVLTVKHEAGYIFILNPVTGKVRLND